MTDARKSTAKTASTGRRPHQSLGRPTSNAPNSVPIRALETVKPSVLSSSPNTLRSASVVPEMTAVSNPNRNDPNAATTALRKSVPPPWEHAGPIAVSQLRGRQRGCIRIFGLVEIRPIVVSRMLMHGFIPGLEAERLSFLRIQGIELQAGGKGAGGAAAEVERIHLDVDGACNLTFDGPSPITGIEPFRADRFYWPERHAVHGSRGTAGDLRPSVSPRNMRPRAARPTRSWPPNLAVGHSLVIFPSALDHHASA